MSRFAIFYFVVFTSLISCNSEDPKQTDRIPQKTKTEMVALEEDDTLLKQTSASNPDNWEFDKVKNTKILFKGGKVFETGLYDLTYIDQIKTDKKAPFLIYSGRDCNECDANISLYFHSPRNGELTVENGENRNDYPGKERDYETDSLLMETKVYYGEVLKGIKGVIWYQNFLTENGKFQKGIYLSSIKDDSLMDKEIFGYDLKLAETLELNKAGKNKEIQGREYTSEP